jgi:hypothetical protein
VLVSVRWKWLRVLVEEIDDRWDNVVLAFDSNSPAVFTEVELKKSSNFVFTEGVNPLGVCACATAHDASAATTIEEVIYMMKIYNHTRQKMI